MGFKHGMNTELWLDGADLSTYFNAADMGADVDTAETSTFKAAWKTHIPGMAAGTVDGGGFYDPDHMNVSSALQAASPNVLTIAPGGALAVGDLARLISVTSKSYKESSKIGGAVAFSWGVQSTAPVGFGVVVHPLAAETVTGTSAYIDGGASTPDGAIAHLHVTAWDGTTPTITVTFSDCASSGGSYVDIAGGAFDLIGGAFGSQRLVIPGTIRRYVKATWTITGTSGPSFTFGLALARL